MHLSSLSLRHFRNYDKVDLKFHPRFNFIFGKNAQGKTNLIEAIYYLANLKSFRSGKLTELVKDHAPGCIVEAQLTDGTLYHDIHVKIEDGKRDVKLNQKKPRLFGEYYGLLPLILFEPWEVYLFRESPSLRRKFIDRAVFLENPEILRTFKEYEAVITQKNKLLKESAFSTPEELEVWNERLVSLGSEVIHQRLNWIRKINEYLKREYSHVSGAPETMRIEYISKISYPSSLKEIQSTLTEEIRSRGDEESRRRESLVGPHREDWTVFLDERNVGDRGSQGENRCAVISLKSAQIHMYADRHGVAPVFLLDDIVSELDAQRTETLFSYLMETPGQVFITTTEPSRLSATDLGKGTSFLVEGEGQVLQL